MFCPKCGKEAKAQSGFCIYCGQDLMQNLTVNNSDSSSLFELSRKPIFLVITVMLSVSLAAGIVIGNFNVLTSLVVLALWLIFASAKSSNDKLQKNGVKIAAIAVRVQYIINYVLAGIVALFGIIALAVFAVSGDLFAVLGDLIAEAAEEIAEETGIIFTVRDSLYSLSDAVGSSAGILIGISVMIGFFIAALIIVIMNLIFTRYYDGYLFSIDSALKAGKSFKLYDKDVNGRVLAIGIVICASLAGAFVGLFADFEFDTLMSFFSSAALAAACFTSYIAMKE